MQGSIINKVYKITWKDEKGVQVKELGTKEQAKEFKNELLKTGIPVEKIKATVLTKSTKSPGELSHEILKRGGTITHWQLVYTNKDGKTVEDDENRLPSLKGKPKDKEGKEKKGITRYSKASDKNYQILKKRLAELIDKGEVYQNEEGTYLGTIAPVFTGQLASLDAPAGEGGEGGEKGASTIGSQIREPGSRGKPEQRIANTEMIQKIFDEAGLSKKEEDILLASFGLEISHYEERFDDELGKKVSKKVVDVPANTPGLKEPEETKMAPTGWTVAYVKDGKPNEQQFQSSLTGGIDPKKRRSDHGWLKAQTFIKNLKSEGVPEKDIKISAYTAGKEWEPEEETEEKPFINAFAQFKPEGGQAGLKATKSIERSETQWLDPKKVAKVLKDSGIEEYEKLTDKIVTDIRANAIKKVKEVMPKIKKDGEEIPVRKTKSEWIADKIHNYYKRQGKDIPQHRIEKLIKDLKAGKEKISGFEQVFDKAAEHWEQEQGTEELINKKEQEFAKKDKPPKKPKDKIAQALEKQDTAKARQAEIKAKKDEEAAKKQEFHKGREKEPEELVTADSIDRIIQIAIMEYKILKALRIVA
jgi:hypothetical protein